MRYAYALLNTQKRHINVYFISQTVRWRDSETILDLGEISYNLQ